jgi:hypothetical protein
MKRKRLHRALAGDQKLLPKTPHTGEHCPNSGWWAPTSNPSKGYFVSEGSIMPPHEGEAVTWVPLVDQNGMRRAYDDPAPWHPHNII